MLVNVSPKDLKALKNGELTVEALAEKIANTYPAKAISEAFVELLTFKPEPVDKIKITEQQFHQLIKVIGVADVTMEKAERRGRPSKKGE